MMESSYALPVINNMAKVVDFYSRFSIIDEYNPNSTKTNLTHIFFFVMGIVEQFHEGSGIFHC